MASGRDHDKSILRWSLPFALILSLCSGFNSGFIGGFSFLLGGLWLSPDLDTTSNSLKRWGLLRVIWFPYRKLVRHRSLASHSPIIGTALRLCYLLIWIICIIYLFKVVQINSPFLIANYLKNSLQDNPKALISILVGLEASSWLHLIQDGDPFPKV